MKLTPTHAHLAAVLLLAAASTGATQEVAVDATAVGDAVNRRLSAWSTTSTSTATPTGRRSLSSKTWAPRVRRRVSKCASTRRSRRTITTTRASSDRDAFFPERGVVYAPNAERFMENLAELEIEPLVLLAYNASWLAKDGRLNRGPASTPVWIRSPREIRGSPGSEPTMLRRCTWRGTSPTSPRPPARWVIVCEPPGSPSSCSGEILALAATPGQVHDGLGTARGIGRTSSVPSFGGWASPSSQAVGLMTVQVFTG